MQEIQTGEKFNTISHLIPTLIAIHAIGFLIFQAWQTDELVKVISSIIYGLSLITLYLASTLYHWHNGAHKKLFQLFDHLAIYLLIAGSYTPFMAVGLEGTYSHLILAAVWTLAILGFYLDLRPQDKSIKDKRIPQLIIYVVMGWMVIFVIKAMAISLGKAGMTLLTTGGVLYTGGIVFYLLDKRLKHAHGIWHLFVLAASVCHYFAILNYVIMV